MGLQALDKFAEIIGFRLTYQFMDKAGESYDILQFSAPFFPINYPNQNSRFLFLI